MYAFLQRMFVSQPLVHTLLFMTSYILLISFSLCPHVLPYDSCLTDEAYFLYA